MARLAFLGLGVMGGPMARHLLAAGHDVTVWNRTEAKADAFVLAHGGRKAASPADAAMGADAVLACVGADADVEAVTLGDHGCFAAMRPGALFIDHTTVSARIARVLALEGDQRGLLVVDAPVSGGQAGAENGKLTIMVGGSEAACVAARPIMEAYALRIGHMGPAGCGQLTKMVNQLCIAGILQGLSEGLALGRAAGLDADQVVEVISKGAAQSWQMDNRARTMARGEFDFGFAVDWMRKDLGLVLEEAASLGLDLPLARMVDGFYAEVQSRGGGRYDTSSLITRFDVNGD